MTKVTDLPEIIIGGVITLFVLGYIFYAIGTANNILYNQSVQTTGANSSASQTIKSTGQTISLMENIILFLEDPSDDIILALIGIVIGFVVWFVKNSNSGGRNYEF